MSSPPPTPSPAPVILASASPRRHALMSALRVAFDVRTADIDETALLGERPVAYATRLAREKAMAVAEGIATTLGDSPARIIGADTIVVLGDTILGKPASPAEARDFLVRLRGREHRVITAVAVVDARSRRVAQGWCATAVWLRDFGDDEMEAYIATGDPLDKAGAYAIQHPDFRPVARMQGSEANVIGLPLSLVRGLLERVGAPR